MRHAAARAVLPLLVCLAFLSCESTAEPDRVEAIAITPAAVGLTAIGATRQLQTEVMGESGDPLEEIELLWNSGSPDVVTVSSEGLLLAVGNGTAVVTASADGVTATTTVTVLQVVDFVAFAVDSVSLNYAGAEQQLIVSAFDSHGNVIVGDMHAWNIVYGSDSRGGERFVMIDGFGEKHAIPLSSMSRAMNRYRTKRVFARMLVRLQELVPIAADSGNTANP
jgi:hypothetical protein